MSRHEKDWRDVDAGIDAELRFHFEERVDELIASGLSPEEARRRAHEQFGDVPSVRSGLVAIDRRMARRRRRREWLTAALADVRHAGRRLRRSPGFLVATVLTLGLGIGAASAVFGTVDAIVLRALPYAGSDRLVRLQNALPAIDDTWALARGQFLHYRERATSFEAIGLYRQLSLTVRHAGADGEAVYVRVAQVSADLPAVLSADVSRGRLFREEESRPGAAPVVVIGEPFRQSFFGGDVDVVGRMLEIEGTPHEIVGVLAADVRLPGEIAFGRRAAMDLWLPMPLDPAQPAQNHHVFQSLGLLKPGVSVEAARAELAALVARFPETLPTAYSERFMETGFTSELVPLRDEVIGGTARILWILMGAVSVVLLITCANVANLFLVRADGRRRDMAVRSVLGAGRLALARHRLAETMLVTVLAGAAGLALAWAGMRALVALAPAGIPRLDEVGVGPLTVVFALGLSVTIGLIFGLLPSGRHGGEGRVLGEAGRTLTVSRGRRAARNGLVAAQVGLCFALLAGAGLLLRSFAAVTAVEPGFDAEGVLTFRVVLPADRYPDERAAADFYAQFTDRLTSLPGVVSAGAGSSLPLGGIEACTGVAPATPVNPDQGGECLSIAWITPGYFETLGIPLAAGTTPQWSELRAGSRVAIPSAGLARTFWGSTDPLGQAVSIGGGDASHVTAVAPDLNNDALDRPPVDILYVPVLPSAYPGVVLRQLAFVIRTTGEDPMRLLPAVRTTLRELDPRVPLTRPQTMADVVASSMSGLTFTALLLAAAAAMALIVGAVGIYGVIAYTVALRRAEIGIRVALGAHAGQVRRLVVGETLRIAILGIAAGLALTLALGRTVTSLLYGVSPTDPLTLGGVAVLLALVAALASWVPATRALRADPLDALRTS